MTNPCPGYSVTTPYGKPGSWAAGYHTGEDYAAPAWTPIVAADGGTVMRNMFDESYGWMVEVETSGIRHRYCHMAEQSPLYVGQHVSAGQHLGPVGSTGNSTGPHLHYEERFDPYGYWEHRPPQFNKTETGEPDYSEEEDMTPEQAESLAECRRMLAVLVGAFAPVHEAGEKSIPEQVEPLLR